ncbi:MAG TPA: hypothetical protein VMN60_13320 [Longimicrobiales bacterium]|nr:hypothetical protein [Longimicrobiales bacterium]
MGFIRTIITLVAVCLSIGVAFAVGHGLSSHNNMAFIIGLVMLLTGAGIIAAITRNRHVDW